MARVWVNYVTSKADVCFDKAHFNVSVDPIHVVAVLTPCVTLSAWVKEKMRDLRIHVYNSQSVAEAKIALVGYSVA